MIVVTAAGGQTGSAVVRALWSRGERVRALVGSSQPRPELTALSADVASADLTDPASVEPLLAGADALYLIWPNFDPAETAGRDRPAGRGAAGGRGPGRLPLGAPPAGAVDAPPRRQGPRRGGARQQRPRLAGAAALRLRRQPRRAAGGRRRDGHLRQPLGTDAGAVPGRPARRRRRGRRPAHRGRSGRRDLRGRRAGAADRAADRRTAGAAAGPRRPGGGRRPGGAGPRRSTPPGAAG